MKITVKNIRKTLKENIKAIAASKEEFCKNPSTDFTRKRKISFTDILKIMLTKSGESMNCELMNYFDFKTNLPSNSAFVQQRDKINYSAFETLFHKFTDDCYEEKLFKDYRLLAVDGSDLRVPTNPNEKASFIDYVQDRKTYNLLHLNALYDLQRNIYVDAIVQPQKNRNEHKAFTDMVDRDSSKIPTIYIADRGYESYNDMAHIQEKGNKFLIRIKDITSKSNMLSGISLTDNDEFDIDVTVNLTKKQTNSAKKDASLKFIPHSSTFDFLPKTSSRLIEMKPYTLNLRFVRFKISECSYELVVTNLDRNVFSFNDLKKLYAMRWGIETSFRHLKYTLGLLYFHSKKTECILGEIFAKLTMYNFVELIVSHTRAPYRHRKLTYSVNFSAAVHICCNFFLKNVSPSSTEALITRYLVPLKPGVSNSRHLMPKSAVSFLYRVA